MDKVSALMDGELDGHQANQQLGGLARDGAKREAWETFHLIGDVMRGERVLSGRFRETLAARMSGEPTVLAPQHSVARRAAAYALSAAASVAAVAAVGWMAFSLNPLAPQAEFAAAPAAPSPVAAPPSQLASLPSDGRMNEYLIAHQEFSPSTEIQGVAPYIRSVSITQFAADQ